MRPLEAIITLGVLMASWRGGQSASVAWQLVEPSSSKIWLQIMADSDLIVVGALRPGQARALESDSLELNTTPQGLEHFDVLTVRRVLWPSSIDVDSLVLPWTRHGADEYIRGLMPLLYDRPAVWFLVARDSSEVGRYRGRAACPLDDDSGWRNLRKAVRAVSGQDEAADAIGRYLDDPDY